jgi:alginate O-acetyltransferase complex protein AlgI
MLFQSLEFILFLPLVFLIYWFACSKNLKAQNFFIIISSYIFYGWWDWRFLSLIIISSLADFLIGKKMGGGLDKTKRKYLLVASLILNLGVLGFFKYFNFFISSLINSFQAFGIEFSFSRLEIILPVGISFYTFQTLSYTIDVYKGKQKSIDDPIAFFAFVSFFPQLVAGPIERATNLLPQFCKARFFNLEKSKDGIRQALWGLAKKLIVADQCAVYVNQIFAQSSEYSAETLFLGAVLFAFQIYADFSGYSDIAIGISKLFGFNLMRNFAFPYFSRDIAEFWRRWHISLSTWFRDYLYVPLGGSKGNLANKVRNTFIIFAVSGLWHGARWNFVIWGILNAIYFLPLLLLKKNRVNIQPLAQNRFLPSIKEFFQITSTFLLTTIAWIFFRSQTFEQAISYLFGLLTFQKGTNLFFINTFKSIEVFIILLFFIIFEWIQRNQLHPLEFEDKIKLRSLRWIIYYTIIGLIIHYKIGEQEFIYFQF